MDRKVAISIYCDSYDLAHLPDTIATLRLARASTALCMTSGPNGWRIDPTRFAAVADSLRAAGLSVVAVAFPPVTASTASIAHYLACRKHADGGQLDAEPKQVGTQDGRPVMAHWDAAKLQPWLDADPTTSLTSTRVELPRLGKHGRRCYLQLEQQTSFATLDRAIALADVPPADLVLVQGAFGQPGDPRTLAEFCADRDAAHAQAERSGEHACWSAHVLKPEYARALGEMVG